MRAVIDTNVWVSALVNAAGAPAQVLTGVRVRRFELVISQPLLEELAPDAAQHFRRFVDRHDWMAQCDQSMRQSARATTEFEDLSTGRHDAVNQVRFASWLQEMR